jgi:hypothetical protein
VADASTIAGISSNGAAALNGLLSGPGTNPLVAALGGTIENFDDAADIAEAADALAPDTSGVNLDLAFSAIETMREGLSARGDDSGDDTAPDNSGQPTAKGHGLWLQGLGGVERSDEANSVSGGLIGGYDTTLQSGVTAGDQLER